MNQQQPQQQYMQPGQHMMHGSGMMMQPGQQPMVANPNFNNPSQQQQPNSSQTTTGTTNPNEYGQSYPQAGQPPHQYPNAQQQQQYYYQQQQRMLATGQPAQMVQYGQYGPPPNMVYQPANQPAPPNATAAATATGATPQQQPQQIQRVFNPAVANQSQDPMFQQQQQLQARFQPQQQQVKETKKSNKYSLNMILYIIQWNISIINKKIKLNVEINDY